MLRWIHLLLLCLTLDISSSNFLRLHTETVTLPRTNNYLFLTYSLTPFKSSSSNVKIKYDTKKILNAKIKLDTTKIVFNKINIEAKRKFRTKDKKRKRNKKGISSIPYPLKISSISSVPGVVKKRNNEFLECKTAPIIPEDRRNNKNILNVATFNVEFLFLKGLGLIDCPGKDCKWKNKVEAMEHLQAIAGVIRQMDVDILQLTEVEDCYTLQVLVDILSSHGDKTYRPYIIKGEDSYCGQNVGLITRIDPFTDLSRTDERSPYPVTNKSDENIESVQLNSKQKGVSKHFVTNFKVNGIDKPITLIGLHLLAFPNNYHRSIQREAQATVIGNLVKEAMENGNEVIVLGDFNDFDEEHSDVKDNKPISKVLKLIREASGEDNKLINVAQNIPQNERFTCWWNNKLNDNFENVTNVSQVDHILLSKGLYSRLVQVNIGSKLFPKTNDCIHSDHFPIMVSISV